MIRSEGEVACTRRKEVGVGLRTIRHVVCAVRRATDHDYRCEEAVVCCFCLGLSDAIYDMRPRGQDRSDAGIPWISVPRNSSSSSSAQNIGVSKVFGMVAGVSVGHPSTAQSQERDSPRYRYHWLSGPLSVSHIMTRINLAHPSPRLSHSVSDRCCRR